MNVSGSFIMIINILILAFYIIMFFAGYKKGFLLQVVDIIGLLVTIYLAWLFAPVLATYFEIWPKSMVPLQDTIFGTAISNYINQLVWFFIILVVIKLLLLIIRPVIKMLQQIPLLKQLNGLLGALFSFVSSTVWIILISFILTLPFFSEGQQIVQKSWMSPILDTATNFVKELEEPLKKNDALTKLTNNMNDLSENDREELKQWFEENNLDEVGK